jgi:hypothetical protein
VVVLSDSEPGKFAAPIGPDQHDRPAVNTPAGKKVRIGTIALAGAAGAVHSPAVPAPPAGKKIKDGSVSDEAGVTPTKSTPAKKKIKKAAVIALEDTHESGKLSVDSVLHQTCKRLNPLT